MNITLAEILAKYSFRLATPQDNDNILSFLRLVSMDTPGLSIRYERAPNYFSFLSLQGEEHFVLIMENPDNSITGIANIIKTNHLINGREQSGLYLGDLRISNLANKKLRIKWRQCYQEIVQNHNSIVEFKNTSFFYTAVLEQNYPALLALVQSKSGPFYQELVAYKSHHIIARLPGFPKRQEPTLTVVEVDSENFLSYIKTQLPLRSFCYPESEYLRQTSSWKKFQNAPLLLVKDDTGSILACVQPRSTSGLRSLVIKNIPWHLRWLNFALKIFHKPSFSEGGEIKTLYLSHLFFTGGLNNKQVEAAINAILTHLYKGKLAEKFHLISMLDFGAFPIGNILKKNGHIFQSTAAKLYQVTPNNSCENLLKFDKTISCDLEISVI